MDFKTIFDDVSKGISEQREEMQWLRDEMVEANQELQQSQSSSVRGVSDLVNEQRTIRDLESNDLMQNMHKLIEATMQQQELRFGEVAKISGQLRSAAQSHFAVGASFAHGSEQLAERSSNFGDGLIKSHDTLKTGIQSDFAVASMHTENPKAVTTSIQDETTRITREQVQHLDTEMRTLDNIVDCIQKQNNIALTLPGSGPSPSSSPQSITRLGNDVAEQTDGLRENLPRLNEDAHIPRQLAELRQRVESEYIHTRQTPTCKKYSYPTAVPQTSGRATLMEPMHTGRARDEPSSSSRPRSSGMANSSTSLRELDINTVDNFAIMKGVTLLEKDITSSNALVPLSSLKWPARISALAESNIPPKKRRLRSTVEVSNSLTASSTILGDRERLTIPNISASVGA
ncbi:uncharacterized protein BP5553_10367 [Venustampulla echinocandica]|uniref:Uncharacterized protein n=1 Tax=Venustampulla echinocandica TaxID=2656787 RepID=A0A370TA06_9HELO|nr:uncharacterized protein BP5553_10367 [Venustampulla echinocandica]RDL30489.1 hypothetical protein BP5553_10367 [Venustampulla echinocandica]